jgi:hypothetical protein
VGLLHSKVPPVSGTGLELLDSYVQAELALVKPLQALETLFVDCTQKLSELVQLWSSIIKPDFPETCIRKSGAIMRALVRKDLLTRLARDNPSLKLLKIDELVVTESHPYASLYNGKLDMHALAELAENLT